MRYTKNISFVIIICCILFSCSKATTTTSTTVNNNPVVVTDTTPAQYGTPYTGVPDPQDAAVYQVNIRAFSNSGLLSQVTARLDSIKALGINVIYLMPVYPVGSLNSVNSPYCVKNYTQVGSEFGTLTDLRTLVDGAHSRNMSVIMDWVANHTSWDNPWIYAHKDWYLQDGAGNVVSPPGTGWTDVAQLNFTSTAMRLEMIHDMKFWVYTANVDGFRCDYADGPPVDFWAQAIDTLRNITTHKLLLLAEGSRSANFSAGFDFNFGFAFFGNLKSIYSSGTAVTTIDNLNTTEFAGSAGTQQVVRYTSNHDVNGSDGTPLELFGGRAGSMAAFVVAAYMKGAPMIYDGQEVGLPFRLTFPFTSTKITWGINPDLTREYQKIILFRDSSLAIRRGVLTSYSNADVCAFTKTLSGSTVLVISNMRNSIINYTLPTALANTTWTDALNTGPVSIGTVVTLQPYSYMVLKM